MCIDAQCIVLAGESKRSWCWSQLYIQIWLHYK